MGLLTLFKVSSLCRAGMFDCAYPEKHIPATEDFPACELPSCGLLIAPNKT